MRRFSFLLIAALCLVMTSCFEMIEDVFLKADGTGDYRITVDMSELFSDPFMKDLIGENLKQEGGLTELEIDSVINFGSMPELQEKFADDESADLLKRLTMRMQFSESKEIGKFVIEFPFSEIGEVNQLNELFKELGESGAGAAANPMMGGLMGGGMGPSGSLFELGKRKLVRTIVLPDNKPDLSAEDESMQMVKMFLENATFKTIYHLPGKVKKSTFTNAEVEGNTVTVTHPLLDMMEGNIEMSGEIKYKKG